MSQSLGFAYKCIIQGSIAYEKIEIKACMKHKEATNLLETMTMMISRRKMIMMTFRVKKTTLKSNTSQKVW